MKRLVPLLLLLLTSVSALAQSNNDWWKMEADKKKSATATSESSLQTKTIPTTSANSGSADIQQRIKNLRNSKRFSVRYDKFRDDTIVSVGSFFVGGTKSYVMRGFHLEMTASLLLDKGPINYIYLRFYSSSRDWTFLKNSELLALVDDERMEFGEGDRDSDIRRGGVSESMIYSIPIERFLKMGQATSTELKIGRVELTLKDEHKEAFRDLYSLAVQ
jgi:hypothetical protein